MTSQFQFQRFVFEPGRGADVVFLSKTFYSHRGSFNQIPNYTGTGELFEQPDKMLGANLQWTSIPSRGSSNTSPFMLWKSELIAGSVGRWPFCRLAFLVHFSISLPQPILVVLLRHRNFLDNYHLFSDIK